jgi:hypothetical protein
VLGGASAKKVSNRTSKPIHVSTPIRQDFSSKADARPAPPEDDFAYFRANPNATTRTRLPFENEFTPAVLAEGGGLDCFVHAIVERKAGQPIRRARWLLFVQGGRA